eukprot:5073740-Amphidinium_carterae.1
MSGRFLHRARVEAFCLPVLPCRLGFWGSGNVRKLHSTSLSGLRHACWSSLPFSTSVMRLKYPPKRQHAFESEVFGGVS